MSNVKLEKLFVPIDIARMAKEYGFMDECFAWWDVFEELNYQPHVSNYGNRLTAPLYQQLTQWLSDKYQMNIAIMIDPSGFLYSIFCYEQSKPIYKTRGEACEAAIRKCFSLIPTLNVTPS